MSVKIDEKKQQRAQLVVDMRTILDKADAEKRSMTAEEQQNYDRMDKDFDAFGEDIVRLEKQLEREGYMQASSGLSAGKPTPQQPEDKKNARETEAYKKAFNSYVRGGRDAMAPDDFKALQADTDTAGGFVVTPQQFVNDLLKAMDDAVIVRQLARKFTVDKAQSLGVPTLDSDPSDADWTSEVDTGQETDITFGKRELTPHAVAKLIRASNKLLRSSSIDVEALIRDRLAYKFAVTQEKAFMTGSGVNQPLGLFTASTNGISTTRDVSTGNTATDIGSDGLIEAKFKLKPQYWKGAQWIFHRDAVKGIRKIKDTTGEYIWRAGIETGQPDTILDVPYQMSEFAPNTFTTGKYAGIIGNFDFYWIVDALDMGIQRLVELYARTNQTGFIGRMESDGMPVLEEAFVRVKLG
ncbi:phage major capsid protein [Paenibacillus alginolyticus]|uniref:phage major capsid protein n=1 Tax=Paenibacillus alginolyticus TaxID=59839 RepID=UPI001565B4DE|nr:phage major capsid protein [Paenibacillus frigoriresistens]